MRCSKVPNCLNMQAQKGNIVRASRQYQRVNGASSQGHYQQSKCTKLRFGEEALCTEVERFLCHKCLCSVTFHFPISILVFTNLLQLHQDYFCGQFSCGYLLFVTFQFEDVSQFKMCPQLFVLSMYTFLSRYILFSSHSLILRTIHRSIEIL